MKAATYITQIATTQKCSIATAEKLTEALHREGILHPDLSLRFRPLFGDFDFLPAEWFRTGYYENVKMFYTGAFKNPMDIKQEAKAATAAYRHYIELKYHDTEE